MELENTAPIQMNNQELQFPVTYQLKVVMTASLSDAENKQQLITVFNRLNIEYVYQSQNKSSKGVYVSFTYEVTLNDRQAMNRLYALLKEIENLKFAL
jgi:putative lipoic acid-binding regulatory protein